MLKSLCAVVMLWSLTSVICHAENSFVTLCYHDVKDKLAASDSLAINTDNLINQFAWLQEHDYHVISIDDVLAAEAGRRPLPENAIMLTFDDGYTNFYERVFPLLKLFKYPAVLGLVGRWLETSPEQAVQYGDRDHVARDKFLTWEQIKTISDSGLVEIASHSYDLHHGIPGNPQGSLQPAATTRLFDKQSQSYETDENFRNRIRQDLKRNSDLLFQHTGKQPRVMVWPYGAYNQEVLDIARQNGMPITLSLSDGSNQVTDGLSRLHRQLIQDDPFLSDFIYGLKHPETIDPMRVAHIDLDYIYDSNPKQTEENLGRLIERVKAMKINTVFLQAFADPDGDGNADAVYFQNRHLPMKANLFGYAAWRLKALAKVNVYAWMPVSSYIIPGMQQHRVYEWYQNQAIPSRDKYQRLSLFSSETQQVVGEIYQDLAKHNHFAGILFHDDGFLSDFEDVSPAALNYAQQHWGLPGNYQQIKDDPELFNRWTQSKTQSLIDFTHQLAKQVRYYRPTIKTARNAYAQVVLNPDSQAWFAQSFPAFLQHYDYTAIMAMPFMEKAENPQRWLETLVDKVAAYPDAFSKTVFELQAVDWNTRQPVPAKTLAKQMRMLDRKGAIQFGYYPDNIYDDHPPLKTLKRNLSLNVIPYGP